jgi:hypothetical protein
VLRNKLKNIFGRNRNHLGTLLQEDQGTMFNNHVQHTSINIFSGSRIVNPFPSFDPQHDVKNGMFAGIRMEEDDQSNGIPFFLAKVINMEKEATKDVTSLYYGVNLECAKKK